MTSLDVQSASRITKLDAKLEKLQLILYDYPKCIRKSSNLYETLIQAQPKVSQNICYPLFNNFKKLPTFHSKKGTHVRALGTKTSFSYAPVYSLGAGIIEPGPFCMVWLLK